jgi:DNA-binding winged helix-turn-helix (wHTH) protein
MMDRGHFRFDVFEVDVHRGELWKSGSKIKLQDKPFELLVLLLERAGKTATREELGRELWPENTHMNFDASLKTAVSKLRQVLGDSASRPVFIKTVHLRGYRFVSPVVDLGEGYSRLENQRTLQAPASMNTREVAADAIGVLRLSWRARLLAILLAVAMIFAVVYVFKRNGVRASRPSSQPVPILILPFGNVRDESNYGHSNEVFNFKITALVRRGYPKEVSVSMRTAHIRREPFPRSSWMG